MKHKKSDPQDKFLTILIMISLVKITLADTCTQECDKIRFIRYQLLCYSNGKVYQSDCHAKCARPYLTKAFDCGLNPDFNECSERCKDHVFGNSNGNCENSCPKYFAPQMYCFSDGNLYVDECQAHCFDKRLRSVFKCKADRRGSFDRCRRKCKRKGVFPTPPVMPPIKPPIFSNCSKKGWVCSYEGNIYPSECILNATSTDELRYRCNQNGFNNPRKCQKICDRFRNDSCLQNCFENEEEAACFNDGKIYRDRCVPRCDGLELYKPCRDGLKVCRRGCKNLFG